MHRHQHKATRNMKKQGNMTPTKDHNNFLVNYPQINRNLQVICEIIQSNYFKETQWDSLKHREAIQWTRENNAWKNEKLNKQKLPKNQTEVLAKKNAMSKMKKMQ